MFPEVTRGIADDATGPITVDHDALRTVAGFKVAMVG